MRQFLTPPGPDTYARLSSNNKGSDRLIAHRGEKRLLSDQKAMTNSTNSSEYTWSYEYYYDYLDPVPVDASKLKYNRCEFLMNNM